MRVEGGREGGKEGGKEGEREEVNYMYIQN